MMVELSTARRDAGQLKYDDQAKEKTQVPKEPLAAAVQEGGSCKQYHSDRSS